MNMLRPTIRKPGSELWFSWNPRFDTDAVDQMLRGAAERAIQVLGGYGYTREYPVERWHRDAKIHDIFEGTEQIQQLVISRALSGMRIE